MSRFYAAQYVEREDDIPQRGCFGILTGVTSDLFGAFPLLASPANTNTHTHIHVCSVCLRCAFSCSVGDCHSELGVCSSAVQDIYLLTLSCHSLQGLKMMMMHRSKQVEHPKQGLGLFRYTYADAFRC